MTSLGTGRHRTGHHESGRPGTSRHRTGQDRTGRHGTSHRGISITSAVLIAGLATIVAGAAGLTLSRTSGSATRAAAASGPAPDVPTPDGPAARVQWPSAATPVARPAELTVPAIGVRARLIRLGLTPAGALQVPASVHVAGWYDRGPRPGAPGPAVIAGHVDSVSGPGVFFRLADLRPGDRAYIRRGDGTLAAFRVTAVRLYRKTRFPTAAVYGPAPGPQLRLITCGGTFDYARRSYLSNVVVYAVAIGPGARA